MVEKVEYTIGMAYMMIYHFKDRSISSMEARRVKRNSDRVITTTFALEGFTNKNIEVQRKKKRIVFILFGPI